MRVIQRYDPVLWALWALPVTLILALMIGPILRHGMFIDGLAYTNAAKNMAAGIGSFWTPSINGPGSVFYGHPPLLLYLESLYFRLFGNHLHTEDGYNVTVLVLTLLVTYRLWLLLAGRERRGLFFFPLLLFALNQETQLRYPNTMLECGLTLILLLATLGYFRLVDRSRVLALATIGTGVFLGFLAKGPAALFLLALPFVYRLLQDRQWSWKALLVPVFVTTACAGILITVSSAASSFLSTYLDHQVWAALSGRATENVADSRFSILFSLLKANLPGIVLCALLLMVPRTPTNAHRRMGWLLVLVGLTAVLPYLISSKQAAYYQLPAVPFLTLGAGLLLAERLDTMIACLKRNAAVRRLAPYLAGVSIAGALLYALSLLGTVDRRDREAWRQADAIAEVLDSLGTKGYQFRVAGMPDSLASPLSYPLTGTLNRRYDIFPEVSTPGLPILYLAEPPLTLPATNNRVVYDAPGVRLEIPAALPQ